MSQIVPAGVAAALMAVVTTATLTLTPWQAPRQPQAAIRWQAAVRVENSDAVLYVTYSGPQLVCGVALDGATVQVYPWPDRGP